MRHPLELGGSYYALCLASSLAIDTGYTWTYNENEKGGLSQHTIVTIMTVACSGLLIAYTSFLITIKCSYLWSFSDGRTDATCIQERFLDTASDSQKIDVFTTNEFKWRYKIGEKVKTWLTERIPVWLEEQPEWLDAYRKSTIPGSAAEDPAMLERIRTKEVETIREISKGRRKSIGSLIGVDGASIVPIQGDERNKWTDTNRFYNLAQKQMSIASPPHVT